MATIPFQDELAWPVRQGRRSSDPQIPSTRQVVLLADILKRIVEDNPSNGENVRALLPYMARGSEIAFMLGTEMSDNICGEGPYIPHAS